MADRSSTPTNLSQQAANALLEAIANHAPKARSGESLHHLADAYAAVRGAMPIKAGTARKVGS